MAFLSVSPRLKTAIRLGASGRVAADIGCDHGKLGISLLREGLYDRIIATDISSGSLRKCSMLAEKVGLSAFFDIRCGDGLQPLDPSEADTLFILGLGGKQIWSILKTDPGMRGARMAVLSPMKDVETLRRALYRHSYHIIDDRIVQEDRRLYQVFSVSVRNDRESVPPGWPESCFEVGYRCFEMKDPLLPVLVQRRIASHERSIMIASGSPGEAQLRKKRADLLTVQSMIRKEYGV